MDENSKCKWYVSIDRPECGRPAVTEILWVPKKNGVVSKLKNPLPLCRHHEAQIDRLWAAMRTKKKGA